MFNQHESQSEKIIESQRETPVSGKAEVVVAGGGPAGLGAAIAAARQGVSVFLVEQYGFLGGMGTVGLVNAWNNWAPGKTQTREIKGVYNEVVNRLKKEGGLICTPDSPIQYVYDPEALKKVADDMVEENGIRLLLHTFVADTVVEDSRIRSLILENKSGRQAILGTCFIDATGDGDVFAASGVPFEKGRREDGLIQPGTLMFRLGNVDIGKLEDYVKDHPKEFFPPSISYDQSHFGDIAPSPKIVVKRPRLSSGKGRYYMGFREPMVKAKQDGINLYTDRVVINTTPNEGEVMVNMSRVVFDATNAKDLTRAELEGRKQVKVLLNFFRECMPGFENCHLVETACQIGVRETRRMKGAYILTKEDVLKGVRFNDVITTIYNAGLDIHDPKSKGISLVPVNSSIHIPYRCLYPKEIKNLLVAGRCISVTHNALGAVRSQHKVMAMGQAAGTAAALCVRHQISPAEVNVRELQQSLRNQGLNFG